MSSKPWHHTLPTHYKLIWSSETRIRTPGPFMVQSLLEVRRITTRERGTQLGRKTPLTPYVLKRDVREEKKRRRSSCNQRYKARAEETSAHQGATLVAQWKLRMRSWKHPSARDRKDCKYISNRTGVHRHGFKYRIVQWFNLHRRTETKIK